MRYKSGHYVPVMLKKAPRKRRGNGGIIFLLLAILAAVIVLIMLLRHEEAPFSTVIPTATPVTTVPAPAQTTPLPQEDENPDQTEGVGGTDGQGPEESGQPEQEAEAGGKNPVESLLTAFSETYSQGREQFDALCGRNPLSTLSFSLAMDVAGGAVLDPLEYFAGLEKGETPGEWGSSQTEVTAASGSYSLKKVFSDGTELRGTVSSAVTRICFGKYAPGSEEAFQYVELVRGSSGYYGQICEQDGLHRTIRFFVSDQGISCALSGERLDSIYEQVPVSWDSFTAPCEETLKSSAGGALVRAGTQETICE